MTKKIKTYNDLINEKQNLELLLYSQKELIRLEMNELADKVSPTVNMINTVGKFATYNTKALLLTTLSDILIDFLADATGLKNKNWVGRIVIPQAAKNFSSHLIANNKDEIVSMFTSFISNLIDSEEDGVNEENYEEEEKDQEIIQ